MKGGINGALATYPTEIYLRLSLREGRFLPDEAVSTSKFEIATQ